VGKRPFLSEYHARHLAKESSWQGKRGTTRLALSQRLGSFFVGLFFSTYRFQEALVRRHGTSFIQSARTRRTDAKK
jgi:hypothetical protein